MANRAREAKPIAGAPALEARGLTAAYHDKLALDGVDLAAPVGEVLAIMGPNGAGKSTFLKAALGLLKPLAGTVQFFGGSLSQMRRHVGYMPQSADIDWDFPATVRDVVTMGLYGEVGLFGRINASRRQRVDEALNTMGIADLERQQISELSGGQKQRTFMARILAQDPGLFLLDEPLAGIDASSEKVVLEVIRQLRASGKTVVVVHHDLTTVRDFCTRAAVLNKGRCVLSGPVDEVLVSREFSSVYGFGTIITAEGGASGDR